MALRDFSESIMRAGRRAIAFLVMGAQSLVAQSDVGFTTASIELRDRAQRPRSVVVLVWMPQATSGAGRGVTNGEYVQADTSTPATVPSSARERYAALLLESGPVAPAAVDSLLRLQRPVVRANSLPARRHPVVVVTTGMNAPAYLHTTLAERLAAQGFLVVAVPTGMHAGRARLAFDSAGVEAHIDDLRAIVRQVLKWPAADPGRVALAAWSVGGVSAAVVGEDVAAVRALVSLDAATTYTYGAEFLARLTRREWRSRVPYLDVRGAVDPQCLAQTTSSGGVVARRPIARSSPGSPTVISYRCGALLARTR